MQCECCGYQTDNMHGKCRNCENHDRRHAGFGTCEICGESHDRCDDSRPYCENCGEEEINCNCGNHRVDRCDCGYVESHCQCRDYSTSAELPDAPTNTLAIRPCGEVVTSA